MQEEEAAHALINLNRTVKTYLRTYTYKNNVYLCGGNPDRTTH